MANPEHVAKLKEGLEAWNEWRKNNPGVKVDLSGADLSRANLDKADLRGADLAVANLSRAYLVRADLSGAYLCEADLGGAILTSANLSGADLSEANLREADLGGANLRRANIDGADLSGAGLRDTILADTDLSGTKGLELCQHHGPSTIGIDTLLKSNGEIPDVFLRGCGVPEQFITYARSLVSQGIEFYSCFISYSTRDQQFAERLHADLQNSAVRCWFAPHDIQGGRKIHEQIDGAIRVYDRLLLILSEESMKSRWVKTEIRKARDRELKEGRRMLFPLCLVDYERVREWECFYGDAGEDLACEIREYFIPDFSRWKDHDSYKKAFDRLLKDLTAKDGKKA
jgi:uncharacterized protein YjbI with pentapeptide repeats